ncbi:hypothetical protein TNCV_302381 [Trichonephila clavipes]|nr:hypothetical protein TNCV_302381 [Trichonephila clavipes]
MQQCSKQKNPTGQDFRIRGWQCSIVYSSSDSIGRINVSFNAFHGKSEGTLMSPYSTILGLLATDLSSLNHGQVTRTTPELAYHTNWRYEPTTYLTWINLFNTGAPRRYQDRTHDTPSMSPLP